MKSPPSTHPRAPILQWNELRQCNVRPFTKFFADLEQTLGLQATEGLLLEQGLQRWNAQVTGNTVEFNPDRRRTRTRGQALRNWQAPIPSRANRQTPKNAVRSNLRQAGLWITGSGIVKGNRMEANSSATKIKDLLSILASAVQRSMVLTLVLSAGTR